MGARGDALGSQLEQVNDELIRTIEGCSEQQWRATCAGEQWSVAVTAHHVASVQELLAGIVQSLGNGQPVPPVTMEMIDQGNAAHAQQFANCTKEETIGLLRSSGTAGAGILRGLSDQQLETGTEMPLMGGRRVTAGQFAEMVLIGHPRGHLESIRASI